MIKGYISGYDGQALQIVAPYSDDYHMIKQQITECDIYLNDGRLLSESQRRRICATCNDIGEWTGNFEVERYYQTLTFCELYDYEYFSLSHKSPICVTMSVAGEFLTYLINFCLVHNIGCSESLLSRAEDIGRYIYACLVNKRCVLCGGKPDLHHVDAVGAGRSRKEIVHEGMKVLPLCREHHTEAHAIGKKSFCDRYHIFGVKLDQYLCEIWSLKGNDADGRTQNVRQNNH